MPFGERRVGKDNLRYFDLPGQSHAEANCVFIAIVISILAVQALSPKPSSHRFVTLGMHDRG